MTGCFVLKNGPSVASYLHEKQTSRIQSLIINLFLSDALNFIACDLLALSDLDGCYDCCWQRRTPSLQRLPKGGGEIIETEGLPNRIWDPGVFRRKPFMKVASKYYILR